MKGRPRKQKFSFKGISNDDAILIGSHGDATMVAEGTFDLSGIIYCPKYTVTLVVKGNGKISFRGKCSRIVIKKMEGNAVLDLADLTCKEFRCEELRGHSQVILGRTRVITHVNLSDQSELHIADRPLIINSNISGSARIVYTTFGQMHMAEE
jgi:hypothetical protein